MRKKFYKNSYGDFIAIVKKEIDGEETYDIGEFCETNTDNKEKPYWLYGLQLPNTELAEKVCEVMIEMHRDGLNSCECF